MATPEETFNFVNNHKNFSSHMNKSSLMLGGGEMKTEFDNDMGQKLGSHIKMSGNAFGLKLYLDEVITFYNPPYKKEWGTVGDLTLYIIGQYKLGFEISPKDKGSIIKVYIDYDKPKSFIEKVLSLFLGYFYAKWCVNQMINGVKLKFS